MSRRSQGMLRTLLYHRLGELTAGDDRLAPDLVTASPEHFERQLRHLTHFYDPVDAPEVLAAIAGQHHLPRNAVLVTFDDGYRDFAEIAWPLLKQYRVPAVLFVVTAFAADEDRAFWWDTVWQVLARTAKDHVALPGVGAWSLRTRAERLQASRLMAEQLKMLTPAGRSAAVAGLASLLGVRPKPHRAVLPWRELRQLAADGATIAAHSRTHELLDQVHGHDLWAEVAGCRDDLVRELGTCLPLFAYPNGNYSAPAVQALRSAGFGAAVTTTHGLNHLQSSHPFLLRRDDPSRSHVRFALQLTRPVAEARALRHPLPGEAAPRRRWPRIRWPPAPR